MLALFAVALCCSGCWGARDIEMRGFVLMLGLDRGESGVVVTAQVAVNERMAKEGGGGGNAGQSFIVLRHESTSAAEAINLLQDAASMPIFLGHLKVVVIGREFARETGLREAVDALLRDPQVRGQVLVAAAEGTAEEIVRAESRAERLPAAYIERLLNTGREFGHAPPSSLSAIGIRADTPGYDTVLPILTTADGSFEIGNALVFRAEKAVGEIEHREIHHLALIMGAKTAGVYSAPSPRSSEGRIYAVLRDPRVRIGVTQAGERVRIDLHIVADGEVVEDTGHGASEPTHTRTLIRGAEEVERALSGEVEREVGGMIERVQTQFGADIFGFVRHAGILKMERGRWEGLFPSAEVRVTARIRLRRFGLGEA